MVTFEVGKTEKYKVDFKYGFFMGSVKIYIDDQIYLSTRSMFTGHTPFSFNVGDKEKHDVRIELDSPFFFAFRGSNVSVFVDNERILQSHISSKASRIFIILSFIFTISFLAILVYTFFNP